MKRYWHRALHLVSGKITWIKAAVVVVVLVTVVVVSILPSHKKPQAVAVKHVATTAQNMPVPDTGAPVITPVTLPAPTTTPTATSNPTPTPNNTAQCNQIVSAAEADLNSLDDQANQQLALMKQIMANQGIDSEINGGGVQGAVDQGEITESFNAASQKATDLGNQSSTDRQSYVNQLESLQCWTQAGTILSYEPS